MKKLICSYILGLVVALGFFASPAQATFTTNEAAFLAANPGLTLIDFEGVCTAGYCSVPVYGGVTISGPAPVIGDGPTYGAPSDWLADNTWGGSLSFVFSPGVNAVGFNVSAGFLAGNAVISLFDGLNLLDTQVVTTSALSSFNTFAGFYGFGVLDKTIITVQDGSHFVNVDNLRFGNVTVPEPTTMLLLGLGLIGIAGVRRRLKN